MFEIGAQILKRFLKKNENAKQKPLCDEFSTNELLFSSSLFPPNKELPSCPSVRIIETWIQNDHYCTAINSTAVLCIVT
jgi:hypothetical protein